MWVFAIAIVLVIGAIAAVAVGRGEPLAPTYVDDPDVGVPADGPLVGEDLRAVRFPLVFRGYRMSEVDALLDRLAGQLEQSMDRPADLPPDVPTSESEASPTTPE